MKTNLLRLVIPVIFLSYTLLGCGESTELAVEAPSGVEVKSASIMNDEKLNIKYSTGRPGP